MLKRRTALLLLVALPHVGTSLAPHTARPESRDADPTVSYRTLQMADFQAPTAPAELSIHGTDLESASCIQIAWPSDMPVTLTNSPTGSVAAQLASPRVVATFDRSCSWMSPDTEDRGYALRHEQVHFAIAEAAARASTAEWHARSIRSRGRNKQAALDGLSEQVRQIAESARIRANAEHRRFDQETRANPSDSSQIQWLARYEAVLRDPPSLPSNPPVVHDGSR